jgi:hypothetical protein
LGAGTIVEGKDTPEFFAAQSRRLLAHTGCIAIKDADNRVSSKGTATFVLHEDQRLIFTAEHVVAALEQADEGRRALLLPTVDDAGEFVVGHALDSNEIAFPLNVVWRDAELDAAVLDASFVKLETVRWFALDASVEICEKVRTIWREVVEDGEGTLPFMIAGYAEWGHLRDHDERLELLSGLPLFVYVTEWDATGAPGVQISMEIVAGGRPVEEVAALDLHRQMIDKMTTGDSPFGGYSGGPIALFDPKGVYLIGLVKEGGFMFGQARGFGPAIDDVARSLKTMTNAEAGEHG